MSSRYQDMELLKNDLLELLFGFATGNISMNNPATSQLVSEMVTEYNKLLSRTYPKSPSDRETLETLRQFGESADQVVSLLKRSERRQSMSQSESICSICYEDLTDHQLRLICGHRFHPACITEWARQRQVCPNCRRPFFLHHQQAHHHLAPIREENNRIPWASAALFGLLSVPFFPDSALTIITGLLMMVILFMVINRLIP